MLALNKSSYNCLMDAFKRAETIVNEPDVIAEFKEALESNAFKRRHIKTEAIYGQNETIAYEILSRPNNGEKSFSIGHLSQLSYELDIAREFDALTCSNALKVAEESPLTRPITLNISVDSALSYNFWGFLGAKIEKFEPEDIIFEILENDVDVNADITHLKNFQDRGYRFALDDFSIGQDHENRLSVFGDLVDFIKIDGPFVRAGLGDEDTEFTKEQFDTTIQRLRDDYPNSKLIAERVNNREEAQYLFDMGFSGVQGWDLKEQDFAPDIDTKPYEDESLDI
ncbi:MAG: EAL domain-containing protein [Alphaproteobacteria bacterium]